MNKEDQKYTAIKIGYKLERARLDILDLARHTAIGEDFFRQLADELKEIKDKYWNGMKFLDLGKKP